jgi:hypothetical protein
MLHMCVCIFVENHPIRILEDGLLISEVVLSQFIPNRFRGMTPNIRIDEV